MKPPIETEPTDQVPTTSELAQQTPVSNDIDLGVTERHIVGLDKRLQGLKADSKAGYAQVKAAISEARSMRTGITKSGAELKRASNDFRKRVTDQVNKYVAMVVLIEERLKAEKQRVDDIENAALIEEQKKLLEENEAKAKAEEEAIRVKAEAEAKAEAERKAAEHAALAKERQELEQQRAELAAQQAKIDEHNAKIEAAARAKAEAEEAARIERENEEQAKVRAPDYEKLDSYFENVLLAVESGVALETEYCIGLHAKFVTSVHEMINSVMVGSKATPKKEQD